jgi:hypothetical protein
MYLQRTINTGQFIGDGKNSSFKVIGQSCELLPQGLFNSTTRIRLNQDFTAQTITLSLLSYLCINLPTPFSLLLQQHLPSRIQIGQCQSRRWMIFAQTVGSQFRLNIPEKGSYVLFFCNPSSFRGLFVGGEFSGLVLGVDVGTGENLS